MYIEQLYTGCLAEAAYYIESEGEAAIIDPLRETEPYIQKAAARNTRIKYIFETHFHADFVSGHVDLAKKTGAKIVFGPNAQTSYDAYSAKDGEVFEIGKIKIKVLHTPGHTLESSTFLLIDENDKNHCIFTGDTLFIGDVGRPDLAIGNGLTQEDLAGMLYDSLRSKIMPLEDDVIVYPAHGAGSACGKKMSDETFATLGQQKETNYALQDISREGFIKELTTGIMPAPQYFAKNAMLNKGGYESIDSAMQKGTKALSADEVEQLQSQGALVLDTRHQKEFCAGHIPNAWFIGLGGQFAVWAGTLIENLNQPIIIIADEGKAEEAVLRLARVGYDNCIGYLAGGVEAWKNAGKEVATLTSVEATTLSGEEKIVDARKPSEFEESHVKGAISYPLDFINSHLNQLNKDETYHIHCRSGYRSVIACSILQANGYKKLVDVAGGYLAIEKTGLPLEKAEMV
jgi:hydroxyacylglutathione hydrolase